MASMFRKLRGASGTALTWGASWALGGTALLCFVSLFGPGIDGLPFWEIAPVLAFRAGLFGLMSGAVFSGVLAFFHGGRNLGELKRSRLGLWGAVAGLLIPVAAVGAAAVTGSVRVSPELIGSMLFVFGGLGLTTARGTIKLAQMSGPELASSDPERLSAPVG
jgi:hypothetical protein